MCFDEDLKTIVGCVGDSLLDPSTSSKAAVLAGPGGRGKSSVMNSIKEALSGACGSVAPETIKGSLKGDNVMTRLTNAVISYRGWSPRGDVDTGDKGLDYATTIKNVADHDFVSTSTGDAKTSCTLIHFCNRLESSLTGRVRL